MNTGPAHTYSVICEALLQIADTSCGYIGVQAWAHMEAKQGDTSVVRGLLRCGLKASPRSRYIHLAWAQWERLQGSPDTARFLLKRGCSLNPTDPALAVVRHLCQHGPACPACRQGHRKGRSLCCAPCSCAAAPSPPPTPRWLWCVLAQPVLRWLGRLSPAPGLLRCGLCWHGHKFVSCCHVRAAFSTPLTLRWLWCVQAQMPLLVSRRKARSLCCTACSSVAAPSTPPTPRWVRRVLGWHGPCLQATGAAEPVRCLMPGQIPGPVPAVVHSGLAWPAACVAVPSQVPQPHWPWACCGAFWAGMAGSLCRRGCEGPGPAGCEVSGRRSSAPPALRLLWCILGQLGLGPCWSCEGLSLHAAKLGRLSMATRPSRPASAVVCS